jgi:threonine/homoserine/homoserine lactone efflux protein
VTELVAGLSIGLAAGITPGPLLSLVVTATLRRGFGAGWRTAVAPLLTDAPIVIVAVAALSTLPDAWVRGLGIGGGVVVVAFGAWEIWHSTVPLPEGEIGGGGAPDVWRGVTVNALSPHPWIFWVTAGGPLLVEAWRSAPGRAVAFLAGFYVTLVGSKIGLAGVVAAGRRRLPDVWRRRLVVVGGVLLILGGAVLVWRAW